MKQLAKKANILAKKLKDDKRIAESNYIIARSLSGLELHKESLSYVQEALLQPYTQTDILLQAKLREIKSYNFYVLFLESQSAKELKDISKLLKNNKDTAAIHILARIYGNTAGQYFDKQQLDSAAYFYKLDLNELKKLNEKNAYHSFAEHYTAIGNLYFQKKDLDSAFYYYKKAFSLKTKYKDPILFVQYMTFGKYYQEKKNEKKALNYYLMAIQNIRDNSINTLLFNDLNKKIADIYGLMGDKEKQNEYETAYKNTEDQISLERSKSVDYALNVVIKDQEKEYERSKKKNYYLILGGISLMVLLFIVFYNILRKNLKHKETLITEVNTTLQEKDEIISQKTSETEELQLKVNDSYNKVIELAKKNDPMFYECFQEIYPDFQKKLLDYSPGLRITELTLCAYTFLGFTIKDIAEYTQKSINTIRNRKQNLRKKFLIPTEKDMGIWLRDLTGKKADEQSDIY